MSDYIGLKTGSEEMKIVSVDSSFQKFVWEREVRADESYDGRKSITQCWCGGS